jgi:hypothetical protein
MKPFITCTLGALASVVVGCAAESAESRRAAAADHERSACAAVPDRDRDEGLFAMRDQIVGVQEVRDRVFPKAPPQLVGVRIDLRATPGVTEQWIGRIIGCHVAHYAVVGGAPAVPSPILVPGAQVRVSSTSDGFRVSVTSNDADVARQALGAGRALLDGGT